MNPIRSMEQRARAMLARGVEIIRGPSVPSMAGGGRETSGRAMTPADDRVEPDGRSCNDWTPGLLKSAEILASSGNLRLAADLCTAVIGDDRMQAVLGTRVRSLLGLDLAFEEGCGGTGRKRQRAIKALEAEQDWYEMFPEDEEAALVNWGLLLGVGLGRLVWWEMNAAGVRVPRYRKGRLVPRLQTWHPRWLRFDQPTRCWFVTVDGEETPEVPITPGDGEWVLLTPYGNSRPWQQGLWRGISRLWLLKSLAIDDWGRASEEHGNPIKSIEADKDAGYAKDIRQELARDIDQLGRDSTIALPPGFKLNLVEARANTWEMFQRQIDLANTSATVMTLGMNLLTETKGGSYAAALAQNLVRMDLRRFDAENESTFARRQVLKTWAALNYGDPDLAPWPRRVTDPPEDLKATADTWNIAADAVGKFRRAGLEVAPENVEERFGIPVRRITEPQTPEGQKSTT